MFKIGDFSRLTGVSVKTLHHYDDIGLFRPLRTDPFTSYRYYSFEQLPRLNRILALKDLGFSLEQIARILDDNLNAEQLTGMLRLRQAELQQEMEAAQERLRRVAARINQIKQEGKMSDYEIVIKRVEPVKIASARELVPHGESMREHCIALINEACELLKQPGVHSNGVSFAIYHDNNAAGIDVEMAMVLDADSPSQGQLGRAVIRELPAVEKMASAIYRGSYDAFDKVGQFHVAVGQWIEANGYQIVGPNREFYLQVPQSPGGDGVMEIQYPVEKI